MSPYKRSLFLVHLQADLLTLHTGGPPAQSSEAFNPARELALLNGRATPAIQVRPPPSLKHPYFAT